MYLTLSDLMALGSEGDAPGMRRPNRGLIGEQVAAPMADYWPDEQVAFRQALPADPPPPARWNPIDNPRQPVPPGTGMLRNTRTGAEYVFNGSGQAQGPELDYTRNPVEVFGVGKGHYIKGEPMSAMVNGRRVDFGRDTDQEMKRDNANLLRAKTIQDMQRTEAETDRIRADTALKQQVKGAKAPAGWQFDPDGKLSRIPGGPADEKFMAQYYRDDHGVQSSIASMKNLTELATQALKAPGLSGRFGVMGMFPDYPGGDSADAKALLGRLKDVAGMSVLEALKAAGNNGSSGLGAVTEFEHRLLQNQLASLDKAQSLKQAKDEITNLIAKTEAAVKRIQGHHSRMYKGMQPPAPASNSFGLRSDGSQKGHGFLGPIRRADGRVSTELSIGVNLDGVETEIPSLVPTLSREEVNHLVGGGQPTSEIVRKAVEYAKGRIASGKSPFHNERDDGFADGGAIAKKNEPTPPASAQESSLDSLPDPATWPQGKVLRDTQTGQVLRVVNGRWEIQ